MKRRYEQRTLIQDSTVLSRYLPPNAVAQWQLPGSTSVATQDENLARLRNLLRDVVVYIPAYRRGEPVYDVDHHTAAVARPAGTLLSADLSGFTAFSFRLNALGVEGAEVLAHVVSRLFETLVDALERWGGVLLKLSGDALTALFNGPDDAKRAAAAALDMQERMQAFADLPTAVGNFTLRLRIGLASGEVLLAEVGSEERVELLVAGATAQRAVAVQRQAAPDSVMVDASTYQQLGESEALCMGDCYELVLVSDVAPGAPRVRPVWQPRTDAFWEMQSIIQRLEQLRPYLIPQHFDVLRTGAPAWGGDGDLRAVTVLFAYLSDASTVLDQPADGNGHAYVQERARRLWQIVERHGGIVNKLDIHAIGHTLVVLFGAPVAQGDDAERAVLCAEALLREMGGGQEAFAVCRVGIASGHVFAGAVGSPSQREYTVMGAAVNLAARLMDLAEDGQVLVDAATAETTRGRVRLEAQGAMQPKGYEAPLPVFRVVDEQSGRLGTLIRERGPLVGRESELALAASVVARALGGEAQTLLLLGEAGIGKTRLLAETVRGLPVAPGPLIVAVQAQPQMRSQPYAVIVELLGQLYDLGKSPAEIRRQLQVRVARRASEYERFLPLLLNTFGAAEETALIQVLAPDERRDRLHELVIALLRAEVRSMPLALVLEDLHWADSASLELLGGLIEAAAHMPLLMLATSRREGQPRWPALPHLTALELEPLSEQHAGMLLDQCLDDVVLTPEVRAAAIERTQGNPLFLAETARALHDLPASVGMLPLPATVQSALQARLDRLSGEELRLLRVASVIGPRFRAATLDVVAPTQGERVAVLRRLVERGLLRPDSAADDAYEFTHSLLQETAYEGLLFAQRRQFHHQVAEWLRRHEQGSIAELAGLLAFHYRRAEDWPETLEFAWEAGEAARALYASDVALGHYTTALEAAAHLGLAARGVQQLIYRRSGDVHALTGNADEAIQAYWKALAAATTPQEEAETLLGWAEVYEQRLAYDEALTLLDKIAAALASSPHDPLALRAVVRRSWIMARQGEDEHARALVEPILEQLEAQQLWRDLLLVYRMFFLLAHGQSRWSEARAYLRLALRYANQVGDVREIARIQNNLGAVAGQEGRFQEAAAALGEACKVLAEIGDRYNLASAQLNLGAICFKLGDYESALAHYQESLKVAMAIGDTQTQSIVHSNFGELFRQLGDMSRSLEHLDRCIELSSQFEDSYGLAEAQLQRVQTLLALERVEAAREAFLTASEHVQIASDPQLEAVALRVQALLALASGDEHVALTAATQSTRAFGELGTAHDLAQSLVVQGNVLIRMHQNAAARVLFEEAAALFVQLGAVADQQRAEGLIEHVAGHAISQEL